LSISGNVHRHGHVGAISRWLNSLNPLPPKEISMQYMLLIYGDEKAWFSMPEAEMKKAYQAYMTYTDELVKSGVMRGGSELKPISTATTVRVQNGKTTTTDGPYAETKEQLGGYYIIDVPTLDEAIKWAAKCPGSWGGAIEIRPLNDNQPE
jgi:hypothetical protein